MYLVRPPITEWIELGYTSRDYAEIHADQCRQSGWSDSQALPAQADISECGNGGKDRLRIKERINLFCGGRLNVQTHCNKRGSMEEEQILCLDAIRCWSGNQKKLEARTNKAD